MHATRHSLDIHAPTHARTAFVCIYVAFVLALSVYECTLLELPCGFQARKAH